MFVQYIGNKPVQRDRLYGTGARWQGFGAVVDVDDSAGRKMVANHPDVYRQVDSLDAPAPGEDLVETELEDDLSPEELEAARQRLQNALQGAADTMPTTGPVTAGAGLEAVTTDSEGAEEGGRAAESTEQPIETAATFNIGRANKQALLDYALDEFGEDLDENLTVPELRAAVRELVARREQG